MQESLYKTGMQKSLYQTADAGDSLSDSGYRRHSISEPMQETLYQKADAEVYQSDSGCRRHSIRQRMHKSLYQTADAEVSIPLSDRMSPASDV